MSVLRLRMRHFVITLVAVFALLFGGVALFTKSSTVQAKNAYEIECYYYDDQGNEVGGIMYHCYGSYSWGYQTNNYYCVTGDDCCLGMGC